MKRYLLPIAIATVLVSAISVSAQSIPVKVSTPVPSPDPADSVETVTGRIVRLDTKTATFTVKASGSKKTVHLKAGNDVDVHQLRRGERVIVTYSNSTALKVEATRATR